MRQISKSILYFTLSFFLVIAFSMTITNSATSATPKTKAKKSKYRGWDYLVSKLEETGISKKKLDDIYQSKRMPRFSKVTFKLKPRESTRLYAAFHKPDKIILAKEYIKKNAKTFLKVEADYGVAHEVIASILLIETQFGRVTGRHLIINRLSRLATIAEPKNLQNNHKLLLKEDKSVSFKDVEERGKYLEEMFYPEVPALIEIAGKNDINIFDFRGSKAGAFGIPQFLPSTYLKFAIDGNKNGKISLFEDADAIHSTANFLASFGWKPKLDTPEKRKIIWKYNHSEAYVSAVLEVAEKIKSESNIFVLKR